MDRLSTDAQRSEFSSLNARTVTADFAGGQITREGGVTLLGEVDRLYRVSERLAGCFTAYRDAERTEHPAVYEDGYGLRGDMENRLKEQPLYLFADRPGERTPGRPAEVPSRACGERMH